MPLVEQSKQIAANLDAAKAQLDQLINEMTLVMRQQFNENFTKINENYEI